MQLREYQKTTIDKLFDWFTKNKVGNPIINASVGSGKSVMLAHFCNESVTRFKTKARILMIVPSKELCEQNLSKLSIVADGLKIGVISASLNRKDNISDKDIVIGTVGSLHKQGLKLGFFNVVLVDECHLINRKDTGMYRELISKLSTFNNKLRVVGWTGTPFRGNGVLLTEGDERLFTDIAAEVKMADLLAMGYLSPLVVSKTDIEISSDSFKKQNGDYVISDIAKAVDTSELNQQIAAKLAVVGANRKKWLVYCATIDHAHHMSDELNKIGIKSDVISSKTPKPEREEIFNSLKSEKIQAICNVACLTTGIDIPDLDLIALIRNTQSLVLYTQIGGRGMRIHDSKQDCLWVDFTDTTKKLGPIDLIKGHKEKPKGDAPIKVCPECLAYCPATAQYCDDCGFEFIVEAKEEKKDAKISQAAVLSAGYEPEWVSVSRVKYSRHPGKDGKPDTMRVDYFDDTGLFPVKVATEFICVFHPVGWARESARNWWDKRTLNHLTISKDILKQNIYLASNIIDEANKLKKPAHILLDKRQKYPKILDYRFDTEKANEAA